MTLDALLRRAADLLRYGPGHADADRRDWLIATLRAEADRLEAERLAR